MNRRDIEQLVDEELVVNTPGPLLVDVVLRGACSRRQRHCPEVRGKGKIDTGASGSFIDPLAVRKLGLKRVDRRRSRGILDKKAKTIDVYGVQMAFPGYGLADVSLMKRGAGIRKRRELALIGRDAMAAAGMQLTYDAASGKLKIKSKAKKRRHRR